MRKAVINMSDICKSKNLRLNPEYYFEQIDAGLIKDQSKTLKYKFKGLYRKLWKRTKKLLEV